MTTTVQLGQTIGWRLSAHAREAALNRGFALADILMAAANPEVSYTQENYGSGRAIHQRDNLAVAVHLPTRTIITVLLRTDTWWNDDDCRAPAA